MDEEAGPGKLAPRLIEDLRCYDPFTPGAVSGLYNILTEPAPRWEPSKGSQQTRSPYACRHNFVLKPQQCNVGPPNVDLRARSSWLMRTFCASCRIRMDLEFRAQTDFHRRELCPYPNHPLHHFRYTEDGGEESPDVSTLREQYHFHCSNPQCSASVALTLAPPRLDDDQISLLTRADRIEARAQREIEKCPERFEDSEIPEPVVVLSILRTYLNDAKQGPKRLRASNKRFLMALGPECEELLNYLGFSYEEIPDGNELQGWWNLPNVPFDEQEQMYIDERSLIVDDVEKELMLLIASRPWAEQAKAKMQAHFRPPPALKDIERVLGCSNFEQNPSSRRTIDLTQDDHPCYASLGARADFADSLVIFAFDRQTQCDPTSAPYYLSCLQEIASLRSSEELETKVALLASEGHISSGDIERAYQYFQISPQQKSLEDDNIIGIFNSRITDAPTHEAEARRHLQIIGKDRNSSLIDDAASNEINTYQQALTWLGAADTTDDDYLTSLVASKMDESPSERQKAVRAIRMIAKQRQSAVLHTWLASLEEGGSSMGIDEAYTLLGVQDRTVDDDIILTLYGIRVSEVPESQKPELEFALRSIGADRRSEKIMSYLHTSNPPEVGSLEVPVGLQNIGNTCYLNSLLQYYFTVKPLRHILSNFDEYEMIDKTSPPTEKRVGSRKVSLKEIERSKRFARELTKLFETMITSNAVSVVPERELARLTLIKSGEEENIRRQSIASSHRKPSLAEPVEPSQVVGPHSRSARSDSNAGSANEIKTTHREIVMNEADSDNRSGGPNELSAGESTKERLPTINSQENISLTNPSTKADPSIEDRGNSEDPPVAQDKEAGESNSKSDDLSMLSSPNVSDDSLRRALDELPGSPDRPPPVPPRAEAEETASKPMDELELGAQQDVTEVIGNFLFQLECAMRATGVDKNGEQEDEIKQLFYGKSINHLRSATASRDIEEFFADIKVNVADGPKDIYAALDGVFDPQTVYQQDGEFRQHGTIARLPPILQIQVHRVQFDQEKNSSYKSTAHLKLKDVIYMDRYLEACGDEVADRRRQSWQLKQELKQLKERRQAILKTNSDLELPQLMKFTEEVLQTLLDRSRNAQSEDGPDLELEIERLQAKKQRTMAELQDIDASIVFRETQLKVLFEEFSDVPYRLQAVFIHRGTASFGHYWIYIHDFERNIWRKYNDERVTEVEDASEIFEQDEQYPATPYCLVYVQDDAKFDLTDPVCRHFDTGVSKEDVPDTAGEPMVEDAASQYIG